MKKKKYRPFRLTKETPEMHKKRVASGVKFRAVVFESRKKRLLDKYIASQEEDETP